MLITSLLRALVRSTSPLTWCRAFHGRRRHFLALARRPFVEVLEDRLAPATLHWIGSAAANGTHWSVPSNWLENTVPVNGDSLVFDNTTPGFSNTQNGFSPYDDMVGLSNLFLSINDSAPESGNGDFGLGGNPIGLRNTAGIGIRSTISNGDSVFISNTLTLAANTTIDIGLGSLVLANNIVDGASSFSLTDASTPGTTLVLNGYSDSYHGGTVIDSGTLQVYYDNSLGSGPLTLAGGTLTEAASNITLPNTFTVNAASTISAVNNNGVTYSLTLGGNGTLNANLNLSNGGDLTFSGALGGTGGLTEQAYPYFATLSGPQANTFNGASTILSGKLNLDKTPGACALAGPVTVSGVNSTLEDQNADQLDGLSDVTLAGGTLNLGGFTDSVASLDGTGTVYGAGLTVVGAGTQVFNGTLASGGSGPLTYSGSGSLSLYGPYTSYSGPLIADGGTLAVSGDFTATPVQVNAGAILTGIGVVESVTASGGIVNPGGVGSVGVLSTAAGAFASTLDGASFQVDLDQPGDSDQFVIGNGSTVNLTGASLSVNVLGSAPGTIYTIVSSATGGISGTFNGLANNATITSGGVTFQINYSANAVTLTNLAGTSRALHWIGSSSAGGNQWNKGSNWSEDTVPVSGDTLIFDTTTAGFSATANGLAPVDNMTGLTDLTLCFNDASAAGDFNLTGNAIGLSNTAGDAIVSTVSAGSGVTIADNLTLAANTSIDVGLGTLTLGGVIDDGASSFSLTNASAPMGTLTLNAINTYHGGTFLNSGTLSIGNNNATLGSGLLTLAGGTLNDSWGTLINPFTVTAASSISGMGYLTVTGNGTLNASLSIIGGGTITFDDALSGPGGLNVSADDAATLGGTAANTFTGASTVFSGLLTLQKTPGVNALSGPVTVLGDLNEDANNQLNGAVDVILAGGTFGLAGTDSIASLNGFGTVFPGTGLTIVGPGAQVFDGNIGDGNSLTYDGTGSLSLGGYYSNSNLNLTNNVTQLIAEKGTLNVSANYTKVAVAVLAGATLTGTGVVQSITASGGIVYPGGAGNIGVLATAQGAFASTLNGSTYQVDLNNLEGSDQLVVGVDGSINLSGASLSVSPQGSGSGSSYTIVSSASNSISGTFTGLANNDVFISGGRAFQINYTPGAVTLTDRNIVFTAASTTGVDQQSGLFTIQIQDSSGNPIQTGNDGLTLSLSSSSGSGVFLDTMGQPLPENSITIAPGASTASFEYEDADVGTPTISVGAAGSTVAQQSVTVTPVLTSRTSNLLANAATLTLNGLGFDANSANDSVTFANGATGTVTAATASQLTIGNLAGLSPGSLNATVTIDGISSGAAVQVASVVAGQYGTATTVSPTSTSTSFGQQVTFAANVSATTLGTTTPTGTVTFTDGGTILAANVPVDGNGNASLSISTLGAGKHSITAAFTGTNGWQTSNGTAATVLVQDGTSTSVTASSNASSYGSLVTVTAALSAADAGAGVPQGTVTFMEGATTLAANVPVDSSGNASFSTSALAVGSYSITASFAGAAGWQNSTGNRSLTVAKAQLTVTAYTQSRLYGQADPVFTYTITGFQNGETLTTSGVTGAPTISINDTATSPVGTYTIKISQGTLAAGNYNFTTANGTLTVNTAHLTVNAVAASRLYGAVDPVLGVTFSGFVNGDPASVVSGKAGFTTHETIASPVGAYTITPSLGTLAATNYDFTVFNTAALTVNKAHLTVTANGASRHYGGADPTFGVTITGFKNGDTVSAVGGQASITSNDTVTSPVGTYTITPALGTLSATNYDFTVFNPGVLTVTKAYMTVTALPASRFYGAADPAFAVSFSGFLNGDTASVISGSASFTSTDTVTSPVGGYTITPAVGTLGATNYQFNAFHTGMLTVTKAPLTVTANPASRQYGVVDPTFGVTITGFVNGDTGSVVSGHANLRSNDTVTSPVGSYTITPTVGTLSAANYSFTMATGVLTVTKAPLTVTANSATRVYGAADPSFSVSFSGFKNGDTASAVSGSASFTNTDTNTSPVGIYTITPALGTLTATNYSFTGFGTGTLTVIPGLTSSTANLPLNAITITLNGLGFDTNTANEVVAFLNGVKGTVTGATATQLTVSNLSGLTLGLQLSASVSVDGFSSGAAVQVATVTAAQFGTATSVTAAPSPGLLGQAVTVTATVSAADARTGIPTGTVTFTEGTTTLAANVALNASGQASFNSAAFSLGSHSITASFTGTNSWQNSSGTGTEAVRYGTSTSGVKAAATNPANPFYGQSLTFTATVANTSSSGGTPTGSVTFFNGTTALGTRTLATGVATITLTTLPVGTDQLTATYLGAGSFAGSSSSSALAQAVAKIPTSTSTVMAASSNPANPTYGQTLTFTATVSNSSGIGGSPTGSVTFFNGTTSLGTKSLVSGMATITLTTLPGGTDAITATYLGAGNFGSSSSPTALSQTVNPLATTTSVVASKTNPSSYAQAVVLSATVSNPASIGGVPAGSVTFFNGTTSLGSSNLVSGVATLSVTTLPVGTDQITATYAGSVDFVASSSPSALAQTVNKIATSTGVVKASASNPSSPVYGQSLTFTATVANTTSAGGVPTGSVTFYNGTTALGTRTLVSGVATLSLTTLPGGTSTITATYLGAGNFAGSTSPSALPQTVAAASTSTTVTASPSPASVGQTVTLTATVINAAGTGITPTGTVTFKDMINGVTTTLATRSLGNGVAVFTTSSLAAGSYAIEAFYNVSTDFLASSGNVLETVM